MTVLFKYHVFSRMSRKRSSRFGFVAMKHFVYSVMSLSIAALFQASFCLAQDARQVARQVLPSVVVVTISDSAGRPLAQGSGFFVTENIVATNLHVIYGAAEAAIRLVGNSKIYSVGGVVAVSKRRDLVLLQVSNVRGTPLALASANQTEVGEEIYVLGNPEGLEGTISTGIVSGIGTRRIEGEDLIQVTAPISPGSSGGPVVNKRGEVIGIAEASLSEGQNLNFAVPADYLVSLLTQVGSLQPLRSITSPSNSSTDSAPSENKDADVCGDSPFAGSYYDNAGDYIYVGDALLNEKFYDRAKEAFKRAIRLEPKNARAHYQLSIAYQRLRCFKHALTAAQQASIFKPKEPLYRLGVSKNLSALGRRDEAIEVLKEAIKDQPKYADYYVFLGSQYFELKRCSEAIDAFKTAVRFEPKNVDAHQFLGLMYDLQRDREAALKEYNILRKLDAEKAEDLRDSIQRTKQLDDSRVGKPPSPYCKP